MLDGSLDRRENYGSLAELQFAVERKLSQLEAAVVQTTAKLNNLNVSGTGITGSQVPNFEEDPTFTSWRDNDYEPGTTVPAASITAWNNALTVDHAALFAYDADGGDSLWWYRGDGGFFTTAGANRHLAPRIAWTNQSGQMVTGPYELDGTFAFTHGGTSYPGVAHWLEIILYNVFGTLDNTIYTNYQALRSDPSTTVQSIIQRLDALESDDAVPVSVLTFNALRDRVSAAEGEIDDLEDFVGDVFYSPYTYTSARSAFHTIFGLLGDGRPEGITSGNVWDYAKTNRDSIDDIEGILGDFPLPDPPAGVENKVTDQLSSLLSRHATLNTEVLNVIGLVTEAFGGHTETAYTDSATVNTRLDDIEGILGDFPLPDPPAGVENKVTDQLSSLLNRHTTLSREVLSIIGLVTEAFGGHTEDAYTDSDTVNTRISDLESRVSALENA